MTFGNVVIMRVVQQVPGATLGEVSSYWNTFIQRDPGDEVSDGASIHTTLSLRTYPTYESVTGNKAEWTNSANYVTDTDRTLYLPTSILGTGNPSGGNPTITFVSPTSSYTAERWLELYDLNWTVEAWIYLDSIAQDFPLIENWGAVDASRVIRIYWDQSDAQLSMDTNIVGTGVTYDTKVWNWLPSINTWYHLAVVRNGADVDFYVNGTKQGTSYNIGATAMFNALTFQGSGIGAEGGQWKFGYANLGDIAGSAITIPGTLDDFRVTREAVYTENFAPPGEAFPITDPPQADPVDAPQPTYGTVLFQANFDGVDGATSHTTQDDDARTCTFSANSELDTAQFKFGTASAFVGTQASFPGSIISVPRLAKDSFDTYDFTIECWVRLRSLPSNDATYTLGWAAMSKWTNTGNDRSWYLGFSNQDAIRFSYGFIANGDPGGIGTPNTIDVLPPTGALAIDTWYHLAATRAGNTLRLFWNGEVAYEDNSWFKDSGNGGFGDTLDVGSSNFAILGAEDAVAVNRYRNMDGWVDDARITKYQAIYTQRFTPPTSAHPPPPRYGSDWPAADEWVLEQEWNDVGGVGVSDLAPILDTFASRAIQSLSWSPDGTNLIMSSSSNDVIKSFSCSTPWDLTTASQTGTTKGLANPANVRWGPDGTFWFVDSSSDARHRFDGSAYVVNSSDTQTSIIGEGTLTGSNNTQDGAMDISVDGQYAVTLNDGAANTGGGKGIFIVPLTIPYDLSSANTAGRTVLDVEPPISASSFFSNSIQFSPDGTTIYFLDSNSTLRRFTFTTPFDASTGTLQPDTLSFGAVPGADWMWVDERGSMLWAGTRDDSGFGPEANTRVQLYRRAR